MEPKKDTVRVGLPPAHEQTGTAPNVAQRETTRIVLPTRIPAAPIRRLPPKITPVPSSGPALAPSNILPRRPPITPQATSPLLQPLPKPPGAEHESEPPPAALASAPSVNRVPKKDTAGISIQPRPATTLITPAVLTSRPITSLEMMPRPVCWALLAISAAIFLIQIWNYVVS